MFNYTTRSVFHIPEDPNYEQISMENEKMYRYFAGKASIEDERAILDWVDRSDLNRKTFLEERKLFDALILHAPPAKANKQKSVPLRSLLFGISIAASLALLVGYALSFYLHNRGELPVQSLTITTQSGQKSRLTLPDGSKVWLNSSSRLVYPSDFNQDNRTVYVEGEAYFEVVKSDKKLFIVSTGEVETVVYGTSFNVRAPSTENTVSVALVKGCVGMHRSTDKRQLARLRPNEMITIDRTNLHHKIEPCDADKESLWHLNKLQFDNLGQEQMWAKLEGWYGVKFRILNAKPETTYRYTLKTETLTELLALINRVTPINYTLNGEEVIVRYK